ncbi:MAG: NADH-quinone oxidoreductase subunit A [Firmicutes bacterium]|nr:NADH-quinone oxidoreductase subunit A [Bacillota bacterium]
MLISRTILIYLALGLIIPFSMERIGGLLREKTTGRGASEESYESGIKAEGDTWMPQYLRYYIYALVFVLFDAETAVLFPWADAFHKIPPLLGIQAMVFIVLLLFGLLYAWKKGALKWE